MKHGRAPRYTLLLALAMPAVALAQQPKPPVKQAPKAPQAVVQKKAAPAACQVQGVWELVQTTFRGKTEQVTSFQQRKLLTKDHWVWLSQDLKRDTLPLKTTFDTLRAYAIGGGSGTYTVVGHTYTEKIEFFTDPAVIGHSLPARCRIEGDRWYHIWDYADFAGPGVPHDTMVEVWRRVE